MKSNLEREIYQQPEIIKKISSKQIDIGCVKTIERVTFIASGSSKNVSDFGAYFFEQIANIPARIEYASELLGKDIHFGHEDLVIFVSQSGKSSDVLEIVERIEASSCETIALVNNVESPIAKHCDFMIDMEAGEELAIPATKSFCASYVKLYMLANMFSNKDVDLNEIKKLAQGIEKILDSDLADKIAKKLSKQQNLVITGSNLARYASNEISLKLQETAFLNAVAYPLGEFIHGHMAIMKTVQNLVAISFFADKNHSTNIKNVEKIKNIYNPEIIFVTDDNSCKNAFILPECSKFLSPILVIILFQLVCLKIAVLKGIDPDSPEGLEKVVEN